MPSEAVLAAPNSCQVGDPAQVGINGGRTVSGRSPAIRIIKISIDGGCERGVSDRSADGMNSVQLLRAEAMAAGNPTNSPKQHVIQEETSSAPRERSQGSSRQRRRRQEEVRKQGRQGRRLNGPIYGVLQPEHSQWSVHPIDAVKRLLLSLCHSAPCPHFLNALRRLGIVARLFFLL